jgi:hypothetical protein
MRTMRSDAAIGSGAMKNALVIANDAAVAAMPRARVQTIAIEVSGVLACVRTP